MIDFFCYSETIGGAERFTNLLSSGFPSKVFCSKSTSHFFQSPTTELQIGKKISKKSFDFYKFNSYRNQIFSQISPNEILFTQFKKEQILLGHPKFKNHYKITYEHGPIHPLIKLHPLLSYLYKNALKHYNFRLCGSQYTKNNLEKFSNLEFQVVPYGIEFEAAYTTELRTEKRACLGLSSEKIVFSFADSPRKDRGFFDLLNILSTTKFTSQFVFWIFGSTKPENFTSTNNVQFFGFQKNLNSYLHLSDYFINPSNASGEAFPLRLLQALMCGNLIISSSGPFLEEMQLIAPFHSILPRKRGKDFQHSLIKTLQQINSTPNYSQKIHQNNQIKKMHSQEIMISEFKKYLI